MEIVIPDSGGGNREVGYRRIATFAGTIDRGRYGNLFAKCFQVFVQANVVIFCRVDASLVSFFAGASRIVKILTLHFNT
jgi:hypothetical protein